MGTGPDREPSAAPTDDEWRAAGWEPDGLGGFVPTSDPPTSDPYNLWVQRPLGEGWLVAARIVHQDGHLVIGELRIFPDEHEARERLALRPGEWSAEHRGIDASVPRGGLTQEEVRAVSTDALRRQVASLLDQHPAKVEADLALLAALSRDELERALRSPGPNKKGNYFYALWGEKYVARLDAGSTTPVKDLEEATGVPRGTIEEHLREARGRGLLTKPRPGRAEGRLTDKAKRVLADGRRRRPGPAAAAEEGRLLDEHDAST